MHRERRSASPNWLGIPKEGYAFSKDAKILCGAPKPRHKQSNNNWSGAPDQYRMLRRGRRMTIGTSVLEQGYNFNSCWPGCKPDEYPKRQTALS